MLRKMTLKKIRDRLQREDKGRIILNRPLAMGVDTGCIITKPCRCGSTKVKSAK